MSPERSLLRIAVPVPLRKTFDYLPLPGDALDQLKPGQRILVPFGRRLKIGYLLEIVPSTEVDPARLRTILEIIDAEPLLSNADIALLKWAAAYYHHPLGEVIATAFPGLLRKRRQVVPAAETHLALTQAGHTFPADSLSRAPRLMALLKSLQATPTGLSASHLRSIDRSWKKNALRLMERGLADFTTPPSVPQWLPGNPPPSFPLNPAQEQAVQAVAASFGQYGTFLLDGVTGSGKTEVYLRLTEAMLHRQQQVMILLPEIGLTPQLEQRFRQRLAAPVAVFHSRLRDTERMHAWLSVQSGESPVLLGTRSAVFAPLNRPGLIIIDEEHDPSFKQQDNFRFSARDVAIKKAQYLKIPVLLGSATPSLESLWNADRGRYRTLTLPHRAGGASAPRFSLLDIRHQRLHQGLSPHLVSLIRRTLGQREQVLLFLNRRGYAPTLICHDCGWVAPCPRCDARLVVHLRDGRVRCHYCGHDNRLPDGCPNCGSSQLTPLGHGTERLEQTLAELFPEARLVRMDRDSTSRAGSLRKKLDMIQRGDVDILFGTQMLAKGHHFPRVTLVALLDVDSLLFATDFRASERMAQLIVQVAGRAGREELPGVVVLQTRQPDHPLLRNLIDHGYRGFANAALSERQAAQLPPVSHMAIWRAEAHDDQRCLEFLQQLRDRAIVTQSASIALLGPAPAPMRRQAGRYRYQLAVLSAERRPLHQLVDQMESAIPGLTDTAKVRWSLDIDPIDCY